MKPPGPFSIHQSRLPGYFFLKSPVSCEDFDWMAVELRILVTRLRTSSMPCWTAGTATAADSGL